MQGTMTLHAVSSADKKDGVEAMVVFKFAVNSETQKYITELVAMQGAPVSVGVMPQQVEMKLKKTTLDPSMVEHSKQLLNSETSD